MQNTPPNFEILAVYFEAKRWYINFVRTFCGQRTCIHAAVSKRRDNFDREVIGVFWYHCVMERLYHPACGAYTSFGIAAYSASHGRHRKLRFISDVSVARVRVYQGTGKVTINDRDIDNYFGLETLKLIVRSPLVLLGLEGKYDVVVRVSGGGVSGQAGAIRHGLSRALLQQSDENRAALKKAGFLTRDPRMKERKKYGLKAARRAPQFSKR